MNNLIYVTNENPIILHSIQQFLEKEGYQVQPFENNETLYAAFLQHPCDLVVMDTAITGSDGFVIAAKIKQAQQPLGPMPIIVLTNQESEDNYVFGISLGISAYLTKPFSPAKLLAHVRALLIKKVIDAPLATTHPAPAHNKKILSFADISMDLSRHHATCRDIRLKLTTTEFKMLAFMIQHQDRALSRMELLKEIWGHQDSAKIRITDDIVKRLRIKLNNVQSALAIETVWAFGFRVEAG